MPRRPKLSPVSARLLLTQAPEVHEVFISEEIGKWEALNEKELAANKLLVSI